MDDNVLDLKSERLDYLLINIDPEILRQLAPEAIGLEIPEILPRDPTFTVEYYLDQGKTEEETMHAINDRQTMQILELIKFMSKRINPDHVIDEKKEEVIKEKPRILGSEELSFFLGKTYSIKEMMELVAIKICGADSAGAISKYRRLSERIHKRKNLIDAYSSDLASLIFNGDSFYRNFMYQLAPDPKGIKEAGYIRFMEEKQADLIIDLLDRYKDQIRAIRHLSYHTIDSDEFLIHPDAFMLKKKRAGEDDLDLYTLLTFGNIACHIGHFDRPQYNRWELEYARACDRYVADIRKMGIEFVHYSEEEKVRDIEKQFRAEALLFKRLIHIYDRLRQQNTGLAAADSQMRSRIELLERTNEDLTKDLDATRDNLKCHLERDETECMARARSEVEKEKEAEITGLEGKISGHEERIRTLEKKNTRNDDELRSYGRRETAYKDQIEVLTTRLKAMRLDQDSLSTRQVILDETISHYETSEKYRPLVAEITDKLEKGAGAARQFRKGENHDVGYYNLKSMFPEFDDFFNIKCRGNKYRGIYAVSGGRYHILMILSHEDYEMLGSQKRSVHQGNGKE